VAPYFSEEQLAELREHRGKVVRQYLNLNFRFQRRKYRSERGKEYAFHGFCRRLGLLVSAIDQVFTVLPPERESIPDREENLKATVAIQSFVLNTTGCLDNLAWIWVYERAVKARSGAELDPRSVGLWKAKVQESLSKEFRACLNRRKSWFEAVNNFRDSLAHRIPLYIPPYAVAKSKFEEHNRLEEEATAALVRGDHITHDQLRDDQKKLSEFRPWMTHSPYEQSPTIVFHYQLLSDYATIDELALKLLDELESHSGEQVQK
jgi:hypothetical protein